MRVRLPDGAIIEVSPEDGLRLVRSGHATPVDSNPRPETAAKPLPAKRVRT